MRLGAARFVAGATLEECVTVLRRLNEQGFLANTTLLGEATLDRDSTAGVVRAYAQILDRLAGEGLQANVALKLTHLGLALDEELAYANVRAVVERAAAVHNFVRIDMEESRHADATLRTYRRLREAGLENVGVVLQSYLYRSAADLEALAPLRPNLRLVKGAYLEPATVAFPSKADVDSSYVRLARTALARGGYTAIATHDERMIRFALDLAEREGANGRFELQMLYGVRPQLQRELVARGHRVRIAAPFGPDWYPYLMRRLAERPANVLFLARNLVGACPETPVRSGLARKPARQGRRRQRYSGSNGASEDAAGRTSEPPPGVPGFPDRPLKG
jgi:proline dehydrogenase